MQDKQNQPQHRHSHDHDLRTHDAEMRDSVVATMMVSEEQRSENTSENVEVRKDLESVGEVDLPAELNSDSGLDESDIELEDDEAEAELTVTPIKIVPHLNIYLRCFDSTVLRNIVEIGKLSVGDTIYNLRNPLSKAKVVSGREQTQEIGILRQPVARLFKHLNNVINHNYVVVGDPAGVQKYMSKVFDDVNAAIAEKLYSENNVVVGSSGETVDLFDMVVADIEMVNATDEIVESIEGVSTVRLNISLDIQVPALMASPAGAEKVIQLYAKFLTNCAERAGIDSVRIGVVFDVANFTNNSGEAFESFETFRILVSNEGVNKVDHIVAAGSNLDYMFATTTGGNTIVFLAGNPKPTENESENE